MPDASKDQPEQAPRERAPLSGRRRLINRLKQARVIQKSAAVALGGIFALFLVELLLRAGGLFLPYVDPRGMSDPHASMVFSGDSWTHGADADTGKGFFDILKTDPAFQGYTMSNIGYGANNGFQIVGNLIDRDTVPRVVVINMGVNAWNLLGIKKLLDLAYSYLSGAEIAKFSKEFKSFYYPKWFHHLKLYRLYCYLATSLNLNQPPMDLKTLKDKLESDKPGFGNLCYAALLELWNTGPKDKSYEILHEKLSVFLKENKTLSLDQKFYFASLNVGFKAEALEGVLKKAGLFFPERLSVVPYSVYQELGNYDAGSGSMHEALIQWSFLVLSRWAVRHNVVVFVQTYPDIKKENMGPNNFSQINALLCSYARRYGFHVIDHNRGNVDWRVYRTLWHVNTEGHARMAENIKAVMSPFLSQPSLAK